MRRDPFWKLVVLANCLVPATLLGYDAWRGELGANPVNFAIRTTGLLALIFLGLTLAVSPAARLTGMSWLGTYRRMMGLCAFFHAALHFGLFFWFDRNGVVSDTFSEMAKRPYLVVGSFALALMVPLAATSTDGMIRRLGGRRWKGLHRLTYLIAILGVVHFYMLVKADTTRPLAFAGVIGGLLGYRLLAYGMGLLRESRQSREVSAAPPALAPGSSPPALPRYWKGKLKVARIFRETPDVKTFRLVGADGGRLPFEHLPGQYLNITLDVNGKRIGRSYTIASPPSRGAACEITVKREEYGASSRQLHDVVCEGDLLDIAAPAGRFTFTGSEAPGVVLIAGGVGITPLMAKIRYLTDIGWGGAMDLVFAVRTENDIIFRKELELLAERFPNLRVAITLSRADGSAWDGPRGRVTRELLESVVGDIRSRRVHICGPGPMMDEVREILRGMGLPEEQVHVESFVREGQGEPEMAAGVAQGNGALPVAGNGKPSEGVAAMVTFARSGKSKRLTSEETVLEAGEELGLNLPYDCRAGICGTCKTRLISGQVVMDVEDALGAGDRKAGRILICQARCVGDVIVDA